MAYELTNLTTDKYGDITDIYQDKKTGKYYVKKNGQWFDYELNGKEINKLITGNVSNNNKLINDLTNYYNLKPNENRVKENQPYATTGNQKSITDSKTVTTDKTNKNKVENIEEYIPNKIPDLTFGEIYRLPEDLQKAYLSMKAGEDKTYNITGKRTGKGTDAISAIVEGLASGGLQALNKSVTSKIGEQNFKGKILPAQEEITGKKYTGMSENEINRIREDYTNLKNESEKRPLTDKEKIDLGYLLERAKKNQGTNFNAEGKSVNTQNALSDNYDAWKQAIEQKIAESKNPELIKIINNTRKQDYDDWFKKAYQTQLWSMQSIQNSNDIFSLISQMNESIAKK
jgi:hypothetical protein